VGKQETVKDFLIFLVYIYLGNMEDKAKITIEQHNKDAEQEYLIVRGAYDSKIRDAVYGLLDKYIEVAEDLHFVHNKRKLKHLVFGDRNTTSIVKDETNQSLMIRDPNLVKYVKENHDKDIFNLTSDPVVLEKNLKESAKKMGRAKQYSPAYGSWRDSAKGPYDRSRW
jgi:hypothetical protein